MEQHCLVGKTLLDILITNDKYMLRFITTDGNMHVSCWSECCSSTWIEHIELPALGFPAIVTAVEDMDIDKVEWSSDNDERILFYGCKITTDKGHIIIDYRNSSIGYYGGNLAWPDDPYWLARNERAAAEAEWRSLEEILTV